MPPCRDHAERHGDQHREGDGRSATRGRLDAMGDHRGDGGSEIREVPRLPPRSWPIQVKNCTGRGSFRPSEARMRSSCSGVAMSPAMIAAGSPGVSRSSRKNEQRDHRHDGHGRQDAAKEISEHLDPLKL